MMKASWFWKVFVFCTLKMLGNTWILVLKSSLHPDCGYVSTIQLTHLNIVFIAYFYLYDCGSCTLNPFTFYKTWFGSNLTLTFMFCPSVFPYPVPPIEENVLDEGKLLKPWDTKKVKIFYSVYFPFLLFISNVLFCFSNSVIYVVPSIKTPKLFLH